MTFFLRQSRLFAILPVFFLCAITLDTTTLARANALTAKDDSPVEITAANGIEWNREKKQYIAQGNAQATQNDLSVFADRLVAFYRADAQGQTTIYRVDAIGTVRITSPGRVAYGDHGVYDLTQQVMVLTGRDLRMLTDNALITARESLEYWDDKDLAVARGNAVVTREDKRIFAQVITAHFSKETNNNDLERIDAFKDVQVSSQTEYATGDRGVYLVKKELATLDGNVKITRGDNQINGDRGVVNLKTGISRLISSGQKPVQGLLVPREDRGETTND